MDWARPERILKQAGQYDLWTRWHHFANFNDIGSHIRCRPHDEEKYPSLIERPIVSKRTNDTPDSRAERLAHWLMTEGRRIIELVEADMFR